jgi:F-type H+-transporting ATPase subunit delta
MLGASRDSLSRLRVALDAQRGASDLGDVPAQLLSVADLLEREAGLRHMLADSGQPADAREALIDTLFAERLNGTSLATLKGVAGSRWSTDSDVVDAVELLAAQAAFTVAENQGTLDRVEAEIFRFGRTVDSSADLQMVLTDPAQSSQAKAAIVRDLVAGRTDGTTAMLLEHVGGHLRGRRVDAAVSMLSSVAAEQRDRVVAEVRSAIALDDEQQRRLADALGKLRGRRVQLNTVIDPSVLGGISVRIGDDVIDGTVTTRIEQARRALA